MATRSRNNVRMCYERPGNSASSHRRHPYYCVITFKDTSFDFTSSLNLCTKTLISPYSLFCCLSRDFCCTRFSYFLNVHLSNLTSLPEYSPVTGTVFFFFRLSSVRFEFGSFCAKLSFYNLVLVNSVWRTLSKVVAQS